MYIVKTFRILVEVDYQAYISTSLLDIVRDYFGIDDDGKKNTRYKNKRIRTFGYVVKVLDVKMVLERTKYETSGALRLDLECTCILFTLSPNDQIDVLIHDSDSRIGRIIELLPSIVMCKEEKEKGMLMKMKVEKVYFKQNDKVIVYAS